MRARAASLVLLIIIATVVSVPRVVRPSDASDPAGTGTFNGTVAGTVFYDRNNDGYYDGPTNSYQFVADSGLAGITVRAFDADGSFVGTAISAADGSYSLQVRNAATIDVRIEFTFVATGALAGFQETTSNYYPSFDGQSFGSARFVKLGASKVDYGLHRPGEFCSNNPGLITCLQPEGAAAGNGVVEMRATSLTGTSIRRITGNNDVRLPLDQLGSIFGIGVDPAVHRRRSSTRPANAFMGTYVKRHSEYGSAGATNTIYHVTVPQRGTGTVVPFITLPGALPVHDASSAPGLNVAYTADIDVFSRVGRIGLGDVDVMDDARTILAVDMDETAPKLYFIPILEATDGTLSAGSPSTVAIPRPDFTGVTCVGTWHPMGIGTRGDRILVGGVCGAESTVSPSLPNGPHPTQSAAFVLEYTGARNGTGTFSTIFGMSLGYERGCVYNVSCAHSTSKVGDLYTADWGAWNEYPRYNDDRSGSNPQAMLANIEITDTSELILGFRDRFGDQVAAGSAAWTDAYLPGSTYTAPSFPYPGPVYPFVAGDLLRVCNADGTPAGALSLESNGTCATGIAGSGYLDHSGTREFYFDNYPHADGTFVLHAETINGSTATLPGYNGVWTTAYDISTTDEQGVLSFGNCDDRFGGNCYPTNASQGYGSRIGGIAIPSGFRKGNGLADLELLCDEAPVSVRSTIWRDLDGDGIRDPGEPGIAGVTVNLYDAAGALVGTAITDAQGIYVFTSELVGTADKYMSSGLVADQSGFTIRLDNPNDYLPGGPLYGSYPTITDGTASAFANIDAIDSDGVLAERVLLTAQSDVWPTISLDALSAGENDSTYGFGMSQVVALSGELWIDADGDGVRDVGEASLAGVTITLFQPDGVTPVLRADGTPATATTAADGSYYIDGLAPGDYRALFTLPDSYRFTTPDVGADDTVDSDAIATQDPLKGMTGVFTISAVTSGDTVADTDATTNAAFVNPTIDAGVVPIVAMGDYVWIDVDRDGVQDADEPPLQGVVVRLYNPDGSPARDADGQLVPPAITDANGFYLIDNLLPGEYFATFELPPGYDFTLNGAGTAATDSDPVATTDPLLGETPVFTIAAAVTGDTIVDSDPATKAVFINPTIDAGVTTAMVSFSGRLWEDTDEDGVFDAGESPLGGLTLRLTDANGDRVLDAFGNPVPDIVSEADGSYRFDNLAMGTYFVTVVDPPADARLTPEALTGTWEIELLVGGMHLRNIDFPYAWDPAVQVTGSPDGGEDATAVPGPTGPPIVSSGLPVRLVPVAVRTGGGPQPSAEILILLAEMARGAEQIFGLLAEMTREADPVLVTLGLIAGGVLALGTIVTRMRRRRRGDSEEAVPSMPAVSSVAATADPMSLVSRPFIPPLFGERTVLTSMVSDRDTDVIEAVDAATTPVATRAGRALPVKRLGPVDAVAPVPWMILGGVTALLVHRLGRELARH
jgi:hypothetical protein